MHDLVFNLGLSRNKVGYFFFPLSSYIYNILERGIYIAEITSVLTGSVLLTKVKKIRKTAYQNEHKIYISQRETTDLKVNNIYKITFIKVSEII